MRNGRDHAIVARVRSGRRPCLFFAALAVESGAGNMDRAGAKRARCILARQSILQEP